MKKRYALIGSLLVAGTLLSACGGDKKASVKEENKVEVAKTGMPIVKEKIKMTMMAPAVAMQYEDMAAAKALEELTNIDFDYINPPNSDFSTKLNLAFASDELPDVIFGAGSALSRSMQTDYGSQGILLPLEDLIDEYAPNLKAVLDKHPEFKKSITAPDGHIYSLPRVFPQETSNPSYLNPMWYNGDFLKAVGVSADDIPKTTDELFDLLVKFRDSDPNGNGKKDEVPLSDGNKLLVLRTWLLPSFGIKNWGVEQVDGKVRYAPGTENYKAYLEFMNKLYQEKLLDQEIFSQSGEQFDAKLQNDLVGLYGGYSSRQSGETDPELVGLDPMFNQLTSDLQSTPLAPGHPRLVVGTFAITHKAKNPEAAMRWADYLYTEEGYFLMSKGPEGSGWRWETNKEGEKVRVYNGVDPTKAAEEGHIGMDYGLNVPGIADDFGPSVVPDADSPAVGSYSQWRINEIKTKISPYEEVAYPIVYMTKDETDRIADTATDLSTYVEQMEAKFITGVESLDKWDEYVKTLNSLRVDDFVKVYQEAYDRWESSK